MDGKHPKNVDPRPKRRRDKDNPYELFTTGLDTTHPRYYLAFVDSTGTEQCVEIDKALFDVFDRFELDDISFMNEMSNHYEHSEQTEASLSKRTIQPQKSVEDTVSQRMEVDKLYCAIAKLPEKQRRRLLLYYFREFTYTQIAELEGCSFQVVAKSIRAAEINLRKFLIGG